MRLSPQALLDLLSMLRLEVNRLVNAFPVLHLLGLVAVGDRYRAGLLDAVYARVALRV